MRRSLTIPIGTSAAEERSCCTIASRQRRRLRPRRTNDMARPARGLWAQLRMAWLERRIAPGQMAPLKAANGTTVGRNFPRR